MLTKGQLAMHEGVLHHPGARKDARKDFALSIFFLGQLINVVVVVDDVADDDLMSVTDHETVDCFPRPCL